MATLKLDSSIANKLIDLLSSDDAFRQLFSTDTLAALAQLGVVINDEIEAFVKDCCTKVQLAEKGNIAAAQGHIRDMLTSGASQSVPMLDANQAGGRSLK
ncbi:NHLP-related RiPP peptide [Stenotrophomonas sp. HITSZ_GD]|uniref:NHLP-related RiPP peptide n=1 Tax=Stenotrophomonas sp. HITSZ_GD TaxID=3037248 RepID=UPI00240DDB8E|nr:NHLP-related RiPP peptide [Stenotrophomonas sp. HITSZ_GD]MDG2523886.1 NHLP-related RiPP peptide [Stenotrophomonas sp. HITSZ_GD]